MAEEKPPTLAEAKAAFAKADQALNAAWDAAKKKLDESKFTWLKNSQKEWLAYRDAMALSPSYSGAPDDEAAAKNSQEYFSTAAALTDERTAWINGVINAENGDTITGVWGDSYGGHLEIVEKEGKLYFTLAVVRGPTAHLGNIAGIGVWNSPIGWFSDKGIDPQKEGETNIAFVLKIDEMQITTANASEYHGARAYFDASYVKVGKLDEKRQAAVMKEAKDGPSEE